MTTHTRTVRFGWFAVACLGVACGSTSSEPPSGGSGSAGAFGSTGGAGSGNTSGKGTAGGSGSPGGKGNGGSSGGGESNAGAAGTGAAGTGAAGARGGSAGANTAGTSNSGGGDTGVAGQPPGDSLTDRHPDEASLLADPAVIFHDDFEQGWGRWDAPDGDTDYLVIETDGEAAHSGGRYLRSTVTEADLALEEYISSSTRVTFPTRVDTLYWRFYARFVGIAPTPHHWVRVAAGTENYDSSGLANTVPPGDEGFWFDFDANLDDQFNFYVYWYEMRSGRCNDGSTTPGCEGDQGTTYHYGNTFAPAEQEPFARDTWICIELMAKTNVVGSSDGSLAFAVNDTILGDYRQGYPNGTWLRDSFHTGGCEFSSCTDPMPFGGFDFRTSADVRFKSVFLDAYYERASSAERRAELEGRGLTVSSEQTIFYDDVVVATARIGCGRFP